MEEENEAILDSPRLAKDAIEKSFGAEIEWESLQGRRACRIKKIIDLGGYRDEERWEEVQDAMIGAMVRLGAAFRPHIAELG